MGFGTRSVGSLFVLLPGLCLKVTVVVASVWAHLQVCVVSAITASDRWIG
jgi:hypothetical protein